MLNYKKESNQEKPKEDISDRKEESLQKVGNNEKHAQLKKEMKLEIGEPSHTKQVEEEKQLTNWKSKDLQLTQMVRLELRIIL